MVTAERPATAPIEPAPPPFVPVEEVEDILATFLPGILRSDHFLANFMRVFDSMLRPLLQQLDAMDYYFDPRLTPPEMLAWLRRRVCAEHRVKPTSPARPASPPSRRRCRPRSSRPDRRWSSPDPGRARTPARGPPPAGCRR